MTLKSSAAGLVLMSLFAMSALTASANAQFESEAESTSLTVSSNSMQKIAPSAGGVAVECTKISVTGTQTGRVNTTVTVAPTYSNCETFLGAATSVSTNGCKYVFHLAAGFTHFGTFDIECPTVKDEGGALTTQVIEIKVGSICKYTIGTQTGLSNMSFKNTGGGSTREIIVEPNVSVIKSTRTTNDFFCPEALNTTYVGNFTITGENFVGSHVGVGVD